MPKVLLIDGHSLAFRAFFAISPANFRTEAGQSVNAVYGFLSMLASLVKQENPDNLAIAFDVHRTSWRNEVYPQYKGTRDATPEEMVGQIPLIQSALKAMGLQYFERENYEGDDVIASLAKLFEKSDYAVRVFSGDRDTFQLVNENIKIIYPIKGVSQTKLYDETEILAKYDVAPSVYADLAAIVGEKSDNIIGVPGVGPINAAKLLNEYGSLENMLQNSEKIPGVKGKAIFEHQDQVRANRKLNQLVLDLPFESEILEKTNLGNNQANSQQVSKFFEQIQFSIPVQKRILTPFKLNAALSAEEKTQINNINLPDNSTSQNQLLDSSDFDLGIAGYVLDPGTNDYDLATLLEKYQQASGSKLKEYMLAEIENRGQNYLFSQIELPLQQMLLKMHEIGIQVDPRILESTANELEIKILNISRKIFEQAGREINIRSPKQLQELIFDELAMPKTKKIKTGYTTDSVALEYLYHQTHNQILLDIIEHRELSKDKQVIETLLSEVNEDNKIRTIFQQTVTATGRLSSTNPNLQNIPQKRETAHLIRSAFIPSAGYDYLLSVDYSQIEMRIMAHFSGDQKLKDAFISGEDLHKFIAAEVYSVPINEVTPRQRSNAKGVSYGLAYGLSTFGLAKNLKLENAEAAHIIKTYNQRFAKVNEFLQNSVKNAANQGYTTTIFGRRRYFEALNSSNQFVRASAERQALNAPIQGSAADIMKKAMLDLDSALTKEKLISRILLQVHDELILEVTQTELERVIEITKSTLENVVELSVPLSVSVGYGKNWDLATH